MSRICNRLFWGAFYATVAIGMGLIARSRKRARDKMGLK